MMIWLLLLPPGVLMVLTYGMRGPLLWSLVFALLWLLTVFFIMKMQSSTGKRKRIWAGLAITMLPVTTVVIGNAMVPMFHLMHALMHGSVESSSEAVGLRLREHQVRVDLVSLVQRPLRMSAYFDQRQLSLVDKHPHQVVLHVVNQSDAPSQATVKLNSVPSSSSHYIGLKGLPEVIQLQPHQAKSFVLTLGLVAELPELLHYALFHVALIDANTVGKQGESGHWQKMTVPVNEMHKRMRHES